MPTHNEFGFSSPGHDPDNHSVPSDIVEDDALWMLLNAYADGEATSEEIQRVESLLGSHPAIAREFAFLELTSHSVREIADIDPPASMTDAIFAATTRRKTMAQWFRGWLAEGAASLRPAPVRWSVGALAAGVLVVVLWSRYSTLPIKRPTSDPVAVAMPNGSSHAPIVVAPNRSNPIVKSTDMGSRKATPPKQDNLPGADLNTEPVHAPALLQASAVAPLKPLNSVPGPKADIRRSLPAKSDTASTGQVVAISAGEQRHMATGTDSGSTAGKPEDLGPDVEQQPVDPTTVADASPAAASHDEPPTSTVALASYHPGSISAQSRNIPPAVETLSMRTQEAVRRQFELQKYGGYGRDAYNNIRRGEVGLSLVGGRF